jgi:hypothetical protein
MTSKLTAYFAQLSPGKTILWCYLIWYMVTLLFYFDPAPNLWLNALGIALIVGFALVLSVNGFSDPGILSWQSTRLFLLPFCVSSFSALVKDQGFILIMPPALIPQIASVGACLLFMGFVYQQKRLRLRKSSS